MPEARKYMRKKKKDEIGMCQRRGNTCEKRKKMKWVCARGEETHARDGKLWIRYVPEVREYMQEREK